MAAVIINRRRESVFGSKRAILLNVNVTNTGDTFDPSNAMRALDVALADAAGTTVVNTTFTAGTKGPITFTSSGGGSQNNVDVLIIGN